MRHYQRLLFGATGLLAASVTAGALSLGGGAAWATSHGNGNGSSAAGNAPPGNNGTVKIDGIPVDGSGNDPHVGCPFAVTFWGYDGGQTDQATLSITPVAPTSGGHSYSTSTSWQAPARTSGSQLDQQVEITSGDLARALAGVTPQAQQGYHLRLEVEVTGSQGSDDKYKVFWLQPCSGTTSPSSSPSRPPATTPCTTDKTVAPAGGKTSSSSTGPGATTSTTLAPTGSRGSVASSSGSPSSSTAARTAALASSSAPAAAAPSAVPPSAEAAGPAESAAPPADSAADSARPAGVLPPQSASVPAAASTPSSGSLAFTGADIGGLVALGLGLIGAGLLLTRRSRRAST